jgi:hypothetical protein
LGSAAGTHVLQGECKGEEGEGDTSPLGRSCTSPSRLSRSPLTDFTVKRASPRIQGQSEKVCSARWAMCLSRGTAIRDCESRSGTPTRSESLRDLRPACFPSRGFAGFNSEQQSVFYTACLRPESCKLPLPALSCRSSFAALSRSCLKVLAICDELLPSKVGDSGGFVRLESHHAYLGILISSTTQLHPRIQPPIIYQPCLYAVIVNNMHCNCVTFFFSTQALFSSLVGRHSPNFPKLPKTFQSRWSWLGVFAPASQYVKIHVDSI